MLDDKDMDILLKEAFQTEDKPAKEVNEAILSKIEERENMTKGRKKKSVSVVVLAAVAVLMMSVTVFAASRILSTKEVAENMGYDKLSKAFDMEGAIQVNESATDGDYKVTFLGITTGDSLMDTEIADESMNAKSMYAVVAIEKADGTEMPDVSDDAYGEVPFFVSPLIQGLKPWQYNICTMNGGYCEDVYDGIDYRIVECDNIEIFADHELYLCVSDTSFYETNAFNYDEETGNVSVNEEYDGVNILFDLPLDKEKADKEAQEKYLDDMEADEDTTESDAVEEESVEKSDALYEMPLEDLIASSELLEECGQPLTLDKEDNMYHYEYEYDGSSSKGSFVEPDWENGVDIDGVCKVTIGGSENDTYAYIDVVTKDVEGNVSLEVYRKSLN